MKVDLINSLIFSRVAIVIISEKFELTKYEIEILGIVEYTTKKDAKGYCLAKDIASILPKMEDSMVFYRSIRKLMSRGFVERVDKSTGRKRKYRLVLTGSGDYILKEYSRIINQRIREQESRFSKKPKKLIKKGQ